MDRHFTVTAFVSAQDHTLLHWHLKNGMWLPPGGHLEPDEDPIQAVQREVAEEVGFEVQVLLTTEAFAYDVPRQLAAPATIMVEDIPETAIEPAHQHIDLIYFTMPSGESVPQAPPGTWRWVSQDILEDRGAMVPEDGRDPVPLPEDVRVLGLAAIRRAARQERIHA